MIHFSASACTHLPITHSQQLPDTRKCYGFTTIILLSYHMNNKVETSLQVLSETPKLGSSSPESHTHLIVGGLIPFCTSLYYFWYLFRYWRVPLYTVHRSCWTDVWEYDAVSLCISYAHVIVGMIYPLRSRYCTEYDNLLYHYVVSRMSWVYEIMWSLFSGLGGWLITYDLFTIMYVYVCCGGVLFLFGSVTKAV